MVATNIIGPYVLNDYVWELLKNNIGLSTENYGGLTPIVPSGQEPQLNIYDKPFLVYGYSEDSTPDLYAMRSGSLSYAIYSTRVSEINHILNTIRTALEKRDESAADVNSWSSTVDKFLGIRFGSIHVGYFEGPAPEETEGGRGTGVITLRYTYFAAYTVKTFSEWV